MRDGIHITKARKDATGLLAAVLTGCVMMATCAPLRAQKTYHAAFYDRWAGLSSKVLMDKAGCFMAEGDKPDSALVCYTIVANRYYEKKQNIDDISHSANAMNDAGYIYFFHYFDYQKAYAYFLQSLNVAAKYDLPYVKPYVYLNLANLYRSSSEMHETTDFNDTILNYYRKAYYSAFEVQDWKAFVVMFYGLGYFAFKTGETKAITKEIDLFLRTAVPENEHLVRFCRHYCSAIRCYQAKDYKGTLRYFDLMLANNDAKYTPERYTIMTNEGKALLLWRMKRHDEAIACLKTAERIALEHGTRDLQVDVYRNLYKFYAALNKKDLAWRYQLIYFQKKDSLMNFSKMQTVGEMRFLDQLHKVNDTVKNLSEERLIQRIVIGVILVVTLVIAAFLLLLIRNYRRLQSDHRQLYRKNVETLRREDAEKRMIEWYEQQLAAVGTPESLPQTPKAKHTANVRTSDDDGVMRLRINKVMENTDEICAPTFSLNQLADLLDMKYWNISHAINEIYGKNFNALLNEYRIKEACRRLGDIEKYGNYTIEAIALGVGFKSRSNFVTTFKNITGLTPSEYLNMAKSSI